MFSQYTLIFMERLRLFGDGSLENVHVLTQAESHDEFGSMSTEDLIRKTALFLDFKKKMKRLRHEKCQIMQLGGGGLLRYFSLTVVAKPDKIHRRMTNRHLVPIVIFSKSDVVQLHGAIPSASASPIFKGSSDLAVDHLNLNDLEALPHRL